MAGGPDCAGNSGHHHQLGLPGQQETGALCYCNLSLEFSRVLSAKYPGTCLISEVLLGL